MTKMSLGILQDLRGPRKSADPARSTRQQACTKEVGRNPKITGVTESNQPRSIQLFQFDLLESIKILQFANKLETSNLYAYLERAFARLHFGTQDDLVKKMSGSDGFQGSRMCAERVPGADVKRWRTATSRG